MLSRVCICIRVCVCVPHCVVGGSWTGELSQPEHHLLSQSSSSPPHQRPVTTRMWMTGCWKLLPSYCTVHQRKAQALNNVEMHLNKSVSITEFITNELQCVQYCNVNWMGGGIISISMYLLELFWNSGMTLFRILEGKEVTWDVLILINSPPWWVKVYFSHPLEYKDIILLALQRWTNETCNIDTHTPVWGSCGRRCLCDWSSAVLAAVQLSGIGRQNWPLCCRHNR